MTKVTPFLMFNEQLEAAMEFYTATFPDSEIRSVARTGTDGPITSAEFVVGGQVFMGYDGGVYFTFSEGISLFVDCEDQAEVDDYWDKLINAGAKPTQCGWIKDPFGLSWQIVPRRFMQLIGDSDPRKVKAVMAAMMTMVKLDVAALERASQARSMGRHLFGSCSRIRHPMQRGGVEVRRPLGDLPSGSSREANKRGFCQALRCQGPGETPPVAEASPEVVAFDPAA